MDRYIHTQRLMLVPLSLHQLQWMLQDVNALEKSLNISIKRDFITARVQRAIGMKIGKMQAADEGQHHWFTYWLIVIKDGDIGAGMLGFKGFPNKDGATEIGYGIDEAYQGRGYMSEAVQGLVDWAFTHPFCQTITATEVENPASRRLLEKLGASLVNTTDHSTSWEIRKPTQL